MGQKHSEVAGRQAFVYSLHWNLIEAALHGSLLLYFVSLACMKFASLKGISLWVPICVQLAFWPPRHTLVLQVVWRPS